MLRLHTSPNRLLLKPQRTTAMIALPLGIATVPSAPTTSIFSSFTTSCSQEHEKDDGVLHEPVEEGWGRRVHSVVAAGRQSQQTRTLLTLQWHLGSSPQNRHLSSSCDTEPENAGQG